MSEILDAVSSFYDIAKWVYDQLHTMKENTAEARALAERVRRLSDVVLSLKTHLKPGLTTLSPEIRACLTHVESYFAELDSMLSAHSGQAYPSSFLGRAKQVFAKAKEFFGAQNWKEQLLAADSTLTKVLGDLETSMVSQGLIVSVETNQVVHRVEDAVNDIKDLLQTNSVAADGLSVYRPFQITNRKKIAEGGNSDIFEADFPDSLDSVIVYKRCKSPPPSLFDFVFRRVIFCLQ
jgi:hypothetical protein